MTPILGGLSVAAILVVISEMLWFNRRLHASSRSGAEACTFCASSAMIVSSSAMCATKEQAALYLPGTAMQAAETPPLPAAHLVLVTYPA